MRLPALAVLCLCACSKPTPEAPPEIPPVAQKPAAALQDKYAKTAAPAPAPEEKKLESAVRADPAPEAKVARAGLLKALGSSSSAGDALGAGGLGARGVGTGGGGNALAGSGSIGNLGTAGHGYGVALGGGMAVGRGRAAGNFAMATQEGPSSESYGDYGVNAWTETEKDHLSTFAADVDTASYAVARRKILEGVLPPAQSVRVEEFVNYFRYAYPQPEGGALGVTMDAAPSPFSPGKHLLRVGVQGRRLSISERKPAHLTFLVDVSGSMQSPDKLPLAKRALRILVDSLRDGDTVALVTYAGGVRLVLPHTGMEKKAQIHEAIESLTAGGSTAMASGIELAYQQATKVLDGQSLSRVVIVSDGDANVGPTGPKAILDLIAGHVKEGVTVTTVGFGMGNYKDDVMEQFANKGNGNHHYVDSLFEAKRIFQTELGGTLEVIAQDVKLQVDFDPAQVKRYRLVGYENRDIADQDFRNDKVDAGEIGSGHTVTALYEVELKPGAGAGLCTVRVRAKKPRGTEAAEAAFPFKASMLASRFDGTSRDFRFATAVMAGAEVLRQSEHARSWSVDAIIEIARSAAGEDAERLEYVSLLQAARPVVGALATR
jgi:Ca-activated chloride channel family protein